MATEKPDLVAKIFDGVDMYNKATNRIREQRKEDFDFNFGDQWDEKDLAKLKLEKRPVLKLNFVKAVIDFLAGYQQEREQDPKAFPRGSEDEHLGRIVTALMKYGIDTCRGAHTLHRGFRQGIICGQSVFETSQTFEYTDDLLEGDVNIELLEHETWGHDPGARRYDRNDAAWQYKMMWMDIDAATRRWKSQDAALRAGMANWIRENPSLTGVPEQLQMVDPKLNMVRVLQYWYRVPVEIALLVNTQTGDVQRFESEKDAEKALKSIYDTAGNAAAQVFTIEKSKSQSALIHQQTGNIHTFRKPEHAEEALAQLHRQAGKAAAEMFNLVTRPTTALRVANVTAWQVLDDKPNPKGADWRFPFVPFTAYQDTDDLNDIKGVVRDIKDPQREINWHHSTQLDILQRGPKGGVWVNKAEHSDMQKLKREYSKPGFIGEYVGQPPIPVQPQVMSEGEMTMLQFAVDAIMRIGGVNAEMMGQVTQKTISGRAIQSRQAGGLVGVGSLFFNWAETKTLLMQNLVRCIQHYYSPEKMDKIIGEEQRKLQGMGLAGPDDVPPEVMYEKFRQIKDIDVDIVVSFQDASPTARAAVGNQLLQLKATGAPVPLQLVVEAIDPPYKEEILAALAKQGEQSPNPALAQALSAGQGQTSPTGVNTSA